MSKYSTYQIDNSGAGFLTSDPNKLRNDFYQCLDLVRIRQMVSNGMAEQIARGIDFKVFKVTVDGKNYCYKESLRGFKPAIKQALEYKSLLERLGWYNFDFIAPFEVGVSRAESRMLAENPKITIVMPWLEEITKHAFHQVVGLEKSIFDIGVKKQLAEKGFKLRDTIQVGIYANRPYIYDLSSIE